MGIQLKLRQIMLDMIDGVATARAVERPVGGPLVAHVGWTADGQRFEEKGRTEVSGDGGWKRKT